MSPSSPAPAKRPLLSNTAYNVLKHVAAAGFPAVITLYFALAQVWHWNDTAQVMVTLSSVNTFLGVLLGYSTLTYNGSDAKYDGVIQVDDSGPKTVASLVLNDQAGNILDKPVAVFKVTSSPGLPVSSEGTPAPQQ